MPHPVEPFKIKMVERLRLPEPAERQMLLSRAGYDLRRLPAGAVFIDLFSDGGGALSDAQWSALISGDDTPGNSRGLEQLATGVEEISGHPHLLAGQGEALVVSTLVTPGAVIPANAHGAAARARIAARGGTALALADSPADGGSGNNFQGNLPAAALHRAFAENPGRIPFVILRLNHDARCGQPVSLANAREISAFARTHQVPLFLDAGRYAQNAWLIKSREPGQAASLVRDIARELFSLADGFWLAADRDGLARGGGLLAFSGEELFTQCRAARVRSGSDEASEGLSGGGLAALAVGLEEALDEEHLAHRLGQCEFLRAELSAAGISLPAAAAMHGVFLNASALLPHLPAGQFPGRAFAAALYLAGGVRAGDAQTLGLTDAENGEPQFVRLALPARVYTESHLRHVADCVKRVLANAALIPGLQFSGKDAGGGADEMLPLGEYPEFLQGAARS